MSTSSRAAALVAVLCCLVAASPAFAQGVDCKPLIGVLQGRLDVENAGGWTAQARTLLGNSEPLFGPVTITVAQTTQHGATGHDSQLVLSIDFGSHGLLVTQADKGVFPLRPKIGEAFAIGDYITTARVDPAASTGRFARATGAFTLNGLFVVDLMSLLTVGGATDIGAWNAEIRGKLCGI